MTVEDNLDPEAVCQDITVQLDANGNATITGADVDGGSSDAFGIASLSVNPSSFDCSNIGTNTVTLTVMDNNNNISTCQATVTVEDVMAPVITCPANISTLSVDGSPLVLMVGTATATDNCDTPTVDFERSDNPALGLDDPFPVGTTTIMWTAMDASGNPAMCTQSITVNFIPSMSNDIISFSAPGQVGGSNINAVNHTVDAVVAFPTDITNLAPTFGVSPFAMISPDTGVAQDFTNPVIYTVTAQDGTPQPWSVSITVEPDNTPPDLSCPADIIVGNDPGECTAAVSFMASFSDDRPGVTASADWPSGSDFPLGTTVVTVTATDAAGNSAQCQFNVTVNDTEDPVLNIPGDINVNSDPGTCSTDVDFLVDFTDNCPGGNLDFDIPSGSSFPVGTTLVTATATDAAGNTAQSSFNVNVVDNEAPVITCPADITVNNDPGLCEAVVNFAPTATDNCPGVTVAADFMSGGVFPVGTTLVTATATDASGNTASCTFNVTVIDTEPPVVVCPPDQMETGDISGNLTLPDYTGLLTSSDNCAVTVISQSPNAGTVVSGTTIVSMTAADNAGNSSTCTFSVTVDAIPPAALVISPTSMEVTLFPDQAASVNYTVNSDDGSTLPTPAGMQVIDDGTGTDATWASTTSAANQGVPYEVNFNSTGLAPGTYTGELIAGPVSGYTNASIPITLNVDPLPVLGVIQFVLVNADSNNDIMPITDNMVIDVNTLPTQNLNIRAETTGDTESVVLQLTGPQNKNMTESFPPYALYGDSSGNYNGQQFNLGNYNLMATPYEGNGGNGNAGTPLAISFELTDQDPVCEDFDAFLNSSADPTTCGGNNGTATVAASGFVAPLFYSWSHDNSLNSATATGLTAGNYVVTVTDVNGCFENVSFSLSDPGLPAVSLTPFASVTSDDPIFALTGGSPAGGSYSGTGVSGNMFDPSVGPGTFLITYTYTDGNGCSSSASQNITVTAPGGSAALLVVDATTDIVLFGLTDGMQISKSVIGDTPLGIIFNADLNPNGVTFQLRGALFRNQTEGSSPPYSLFGDIGDNIRGKVFPVGDYMLTADPKSGPTIVVNFSVIDGPPGNQPPVAQASGVSDGATAFKVNFSSAGSNDPDGMIMNYFWEFGDGATSAVENPMYTYASGGTYTVKLTVTDDDGATDDITISVDAVDPNDVLSVVSFTLVNADTNSDLFELSDNMVIDLDDIAGINLNIRANTNPGIVGSVQFSLTGAATENNVESFAPYALYGDVSGNYNPASLGIGSYTLTATPYSGSGTSGDVGLPLTIDFEITDQTLFLKPTAVVNLMQVSPNPADDVVSMKFDRPAKIEEFSVFDMTGRLIRTLRGVAADDLNEYQLRVYDLPIGTYFVRTVDDQGRQFQQRMVIKRK